MNIPHITIEHWNKGLDFARNCTEFSMLVAINKAAELALAECANKAVAPELVDPHAELRAMYDQQGKDGTRQNYRWDNRPLQGCD